MDAIVGGGGSPDEVVLREVARREPGVAVPACGRHGPREATLHRRAPNLYRFAGDFGQGAAGLAHLRLPGPRVAPSRDRADQLGRGLGTARGLRGRVLRGRRPGGEPAAHRRVRSRRSRRGERPPRRGRRGRVHQGLLRPRGVPQGAGATGPRSGARDPGRTWADRRSCAASGPSAAASRGVTGSSYVASRPAARLPCPVREGFPRHVPRRGQHGARDGLPRRDGGTRERAASAPMATWRACAPSSRASAFSCWAGPCASITTARPWSPPHSCGWARPRRAARRRCSSPWRRSPRWTSRSAGCSSPSLILETGRPRAPAGAPRRGQPYQAAMAPIVQVKRVSSALAGETAGAQAAPNQERRRVRRPVARAVRVRPSPSRRQRSVSPDHHQPGAARDLHERVRASARRAADRRERRAPAGARARRWPGAGWRRARSAPLLAPASCMSQERDWASQAPSSTAAQSCSAPEKGTSTGPRSAAPVAHENGHVAGRLVEQREQPRVLEEAVGGVDEQQVRVLLGREPREVRARGRST